MTPANGGWVSPAVEHITLGPLHYHVPAPLPPHLAVFASPSHRPAFAGVSAVDVEDLADRVIADAPGAGAVVLHAAAVRVTGGVVLLVAPPGTGKTTAAVHAGARAFAYNGVLVRPDHGKGAPTVWALPFAGGPAHQHPEEQVRWTEELPLRAVLSLARGDTPAFEWLTGVAATTCTICACVRPRSGDRHATARAVVALEIASRVRAGRIVVPMSSAWLDVLDAGLKGL